MRLREAAGDDAMPVSGYEHRTFECTACGDVERRLVLVKELEASRTEAARPAVPSASAPDKQDPPATAENDASRTVPFGQRALFGLYHAWLGVRPRKKLRSAGSNTTGEQVSPPPKDPVPEAPPEPVLKMAPGLSDLREPLTELTVAPASLQTDDERDECEVMLRRAIEMVHDDPPSPQPPVADADQAKAESAMDSAPGRLETELAPTAPKPASMAVRIHRDHERGKYVVTNTESRMPIMRHPDAEWLRAMCNRMGWHIEESVGADSRQT